MENKFIHFLKYITNNEAHPKHEMEFDIAFFIITTLALIAGIILLIYKNMLEWTAFLIIEYIWCIDNMRHNRS